jgi:hypothetical protein
MNHAEGKAHAAQLRAAQHEAWTAQLATMRRHLPELRATQEELAHGAEQVHASEGRIALLYGLCALENLGDLHASAVAALEQDRLATAKALARDAIGVAVNAAYILEEPGEEGVTATLHSHLYAQRKRFTAWQAAEPENTRVAQDLDALVSGCRMSMWYALAPGWRTVATRAQSVDMGPLVHPALAAATNTEQDAAQDILNFLHCHRGTQEERDAAHGYRRARATTDALFLEATGLRLFADVLRRIATTLREAVPVTVAESAMRRMDAVLDDHRRLAQAQRGEQTTYIASFGPLNDPLGNMIPRMRRRRA